MDIDQSLNLRTDTVVDRLLVAAMSLLFFLTVGLVTLQVLVRTLELPISAAWTEPLARFSLVVGTYFGAAVASRNGEHIQMDIVLRKMEEVSPRTKATFDVLVYIVVTVTLSITVLILYQGAFGNWNTNWPDVQWLTLGMMYLAIALGLTFMLIYELLKIRESDTVLTWYRSARLRAETTREEP